MKILVVGACPYPAGLGSQVYLGATTNALLSMGYQVRVAVYGWGETGEGTGRAVALAPCPGVISGHGTPDLVAPLLRASTWGRIPKRVTSGPNRRKLLDDVALWQLLRRLRKTDPPDVVCAHNHESLVVSLMAGFSRVVYFAHNALSEELPWYATDDRLRRLAEVIGHGVDSLLPRRASLVIVPHHRLAGHLVLRGCPQDKIRILPPPAEPLLLEAPLLSRERVEPCPAVVYFGNLDAYQNTGMLLRAMTRARESRPNMRLIVVSRDPAVIPGAEMVQDRGLETLADMLARDVIVAIPRAGWSGYPIKLVNALSAGKPIVTTTSAAWELENNVHALVVDERDDRAFAEALVRLVDHEELRLRLGRQARVLALERHHPEQYAASLDALIRDTFVTTAN
ncbi:MAG TPA: glycosyltransferase family 4 protein [Candidatus Hydrogenedentes bacterium]|nr:glycosyltransferase family 4 protein [Candidatus Hydrogenedentota bacterium]HOK89299.1 glycosyltransferase family 4 protein [Candidatus Hydrogenedentota bacterium]HOV60262.1 glycosyltransferase family 4 protein [Candidatus Hydrogenedentota bacterium]